MIIYNPQGRRATPFTRLAGESDAGTGALTRGTLGEPSYQQRQPRPAHFNHVFLVLEPLG